MRAIKLAIMRHGPAHNQLLSPLLPYLAICENHSPVTLHVPFEHNEMIHRLRAFNYEMTESQREHLLQDTGKALSRLLGNVPGLTADLNRINPAKQNTAVTHLRLVLTASELSLLPFELTLAPEGFPGKGQPILLQPEAPVCLTRETRCMGGDRVEWPAEPSILFAWAAAAGKSPPPVMSHLLAFRYILAPWIDNSRHKLSDCLTVLPNASIEAIQNACATRRYTHVHILAHGQSLDDAYDRKFGIELQGLNGKPDLVTGRRLATALRPGQQDDCGILGCPAVVTLASCDSGNVGDVKGVSASIAHALHESGIPLVLASQFPLSFGASVRMVEIFYGGIFWGEDPRHLLINLRRRLHAEFPDTHDWASLVVYSSFSVDFESRLSDIQIKRTRDSMDRVFRIISDLDRSITVEEKERQNQKLCSANAKLDILEQRYPEKLNEILQLRATAAKRRAQLEFMCDRHAHSDPHTNPTLANDTEKMAQNTNKALEKCRRYLREARTFYRYSYHSDTRQHWKLVQFLSLSLVLQHAQDGTDIGDEWSTPETLQALWRTAELLSLSDLDSQDQLTREWAAANLIELTIIAPLLPGNALNFHEDSLKTKIRSHLQKMINGKSCDPFVRESTRFQIARYPTWFLNPCFVEKKSQKSKQAEETVIALATLALGWLEKYTLPDAEITQITAQP